MALRLLNTLSRKRAYQASRFKSSLVLSYTAASVSSFSAVQALSGLYDGNTSSGFRGEGVGSACVIRTTLSSYLAHSKYLKSVYISIRQFDGHYNGFSGLEIWNGAYTFKMYDTTSLGYGEYTIDVKNSCLFPDKEFVFVFKNLFNSNNCSVAELTLYGV